MKAKFFSIITYVVITVVLVLLFDYLWPDKNFLTSIAPLVVSGLITHFIRKVFDFIYDIYNRCKEKPFFCVSFNVDNILRKFIGYGASCGEVIQAGNFKADYKVVAELKVTIQNESPYTVYEVDVTFTPNKYSKEFTLIDTRENKLQPLEGNKHIDYTLRIISYYYDVYASDVDKEIHKINIIGKDVSILNGSKINIKYRDSKHKSHTTVKVIE